MVGLYYFSLEDYKSSEDTKEVAVDSDIEVLAASAANGDGESRKRSFRGFEISSLF